MCSWTGVAAANVGYGGQTICSVFKFKGNELPEGDDFDDVCDALIDLEMLIIDEVSMLEPSKLALLSILLDRCRRRNHRFRGLMPNGFGDYHVVLCGDFAQLQPVGTSLLSSNLKGQSALGKRLFEGFAKVVKLRRVYRQKCTTEFDTKFRDSTLRLRDAAPTKEDLDLWYDRDFANMPEDAKIPYEDPQALWLCAENRLAGKRNADVLINLAKQEAKPTVYETIAAYPGTKRAERRAAKDFKQVRHRIRWCIGCRVMLIQNRLYGVELPRLGLMNGAMGTIVAAHWEDSPDGNGKTPVLLVRFPTYTGTAVYDFDPKVIPIRCEEIRSQSQCGCIRWQLPCRLAHGITGHKCQGLSIDDYVVVDCYTSTGRKATAICGWAFVCFTRSRHPSKLAFKHLPQPADFVAPRSNLFFHAREVETGSRQGRYFVRNVYIGMGVLLHIRSRRKLSAIYFCFCFIHVVCCFLTREAFETYTDALHEQTLCDLGIQAELAAHLAGAPATEHEDIRQMLSARGVAPVPPCTEQLISGASGVYRTQDEVLNKGKDLRLPKSGYKRSGL